MAVNLRSPRLEAVLGVQPGALDARALHRLVEVGVCELEELDFKAAPTRDPAELAKDVAAMAPTRGEGSSSLGWPR